MTHSTATCRNRCSAMNHIYHRFLELERVTRGRIDEVYNSLMASRVMRYRYYIIAILSLLLVVEVVPIFIWVGVGSVPSNPFPEDPGAYALLLIGIFGATLLAWVGMAGLIVMERTIHYFSIRTAYYLLVVFPLFLMAGFGIPSFLTSSSIDAVAFATLIVVPIVGIVGTVLTRRIRFPRQYIVIGALGMWAVFTVGGWGWLYLIMIDNGLSAFTGQERKEAEDALDSALWCGDPLGLDIPPAIRVVRGDDGNFRVLGYTWWGLPSGASSCGPYRQWNRW